MLDQEIIQFLSRNPKHASTARELARHLRVPASERGSFREKLKRLAAEGKIIRHRGNRYASSQKENTLTGIIKIHSEGYGFVIPDSADGPDVFIPSRYINYALPSDRVIVSYSQKKGDARREGKVVQVLKRGRDRWIGRLEKKGKGYYVVNEEFGSPLDIIVSPSMLHRARLGQTVVAAITHYHGAGKPMRGEIIEVLGEPCEEDTEVAAILYKHDIRRNFSQNVQDEVARLGEKISDDELERRIDLRALPFLTIDGVNAKDFDDAVYVEKQKGYYHLFVSIADVAHYVRGGAKVDQEALSRGTSVYFPDFAVPMLPEKLSNDLCSLKPGEDRLTLTCEIKLDKEGKPLEALVYESVISSRKRGIYDEIQSFFDGVPYSEETLSPELIKSLNEMKKLAELLMHQRAVRGVLEFDFPEAEIVYDHSGKITAIVPAKRFFSHRLIEEFMISANVAVATLFSKSSIPVLYRVHDNPDLIKIEDFLRTVRHLGFKFSLSHITRPKELAKFVGGIKGHPAEGFLHYLLLRSMKQAVYDSHNRGHFGLNLKDYCHFTSPIRRYPDLIVHRQLKSLIQQTSGRKLHIVFEKRRGEIYSGDGGKKGLYSMRDMGHFGGISSKREREAMEAEREMLDFKRAFFMQNHIHDKFFGTVRRVVKFGLFVELEPHYVEGLLHVRDLEGDYYKFDEKRMKLVGRKRGKIFSTGDKIWVRVKNVSLANRIIELSYASL